jgi:hypothetical protein
MVFLGDATLQVSAPDEIEASQLELSRDPAGFPRISTKGFSPA